MTPESERGDALYLKLKGAMERLCVCQTLVTDDTDRRALQKAIDGIIYVGAQLPQWSRFDLHDVPASGEAPT